jgi:hypothetical protein
MSGKNLNEINPELKEHDRIILLHMDGEDVPVGSKGKVIGIINQPKFKSSDPGYGYSVEWTDSETGNFISKLPILPEVDGWMFDKDYYENETLKENLFFITKKNINKIKI